MKFGNHASIVMLAMLSSCTQYFKPVQTIFHNPVQADSAIQANINMDRYFIMHSGKAYYTMHDLKVQSDSLQVRFIPRFVPKEHGLFIRHQKKFTKDTVVEEKYFIIDPNERKYRYFHDQDAVLLENHLYLKKTMILDTGVAVVVHDSTIQRMVKIQHDQERTRNANMLEFGIVLLSIVAIFAIGFVIGLGN